MEKSTCCSFLDRINVAAEKARTYIVMPDTKKQNTCDSTVLQAKSDFEDFCNSLFTVSDTYRENVTLEETVKYSDFGCLVISYGKYILKTHPELTLEWVQEVGSNFGKLLAKWEPEKHTPFVYILKQECQQRGMIGYAFLKSHLDYKWIWYNSETDEVFPCTSETQILAKEKGWTQTIREYEKVSLYAHAEDYEDTQYLEILPATKENPYEIAEYNHLKNALAKIVNLSTFELDLIELIHVELGNQISAEKLPLIHDLCKKHNRPSLTLNEIKAIKKWIYLMIRLNEAETRKFICG